MSTTQVGNMKKGDKVKIVHGKYKGQTGKVSFLMENGAMVERNVKEERRFCPVQFKHLEAI